MCKKFYLCKKYIKKLLCINYISIFAKKYLTMLDLSHELCEAKQSLESWKWLNERRLYPHVVVENMMRRVYAMDFIWKDYESHSLPHLDVGLKASFEMESYYFAKVQDCVDPNLAAWLDRNRSKHVGGISFSYWDGLATSAEDNDNILEEIEFSYVFHFLLDKCVLNWIALCQSGNDPKNSMCIITDRMFFEDEEYTYEKMKFFFQEHYVKMYMRNHMPEGASDHSFIFLGDKFSQATSNFCEYICKTPGLCDLIKSGPYRDLNQSLNEFEQSLHANGAFTHVIGTRVSNIRKRYKEIEGTLLKLISVDSSVTQNDIFDIEEYRRRLQNGEELIDYFSICGHPYVCAKLAEKLLTHGLKRAEGFVFLQKALVCSFSFPNPFWNNCEAMCGCADAVELLRRHLRESDVREFEGLFSVSLFKIQYLLLRRVIFLVRDAKVRRYYERMLATIIGRNVEALYDMKITEDIAMCYAAKLCGSEKYSEGEYCLAEILFKQVDSHVFNLYWIGNLRIEKSVVADLVRFVSSASQKGLGLSDFYSTTTIGSCDTSECGGSPQKAWSKSFTESEQRVIDIATLKDSLSDFEKFFSDNNIECLYHFTDRANLESIKNNGGLWSCRYLCSNNIHTLPGGDENLQSIDRKCGLDDYVRLSFCERHPMGWRLKMNNNRDFVVLKIRKDVAFCKDTLYSDVNAATPEHNHGGGLADLKSVNLDAVNAEYTPMNSERLEQATAEVMVKTNIPLKYILNINNPESF